MADLGGLKTVGDSRMSHRNSSVASAWRRSSLEVNKFLIEVIESSSSTFGSDDASGVRRTASDAGESF